MDSVTSYGSGGSEEALLPEVRVATTGSPRRTTRENLPLLRVRVRSQRLQSDYEDIDVESENSFPGKDFSKKRRGLDEFTKKTIPTRACSAPVSKLIG